MKFHGVGDRHAILTVHSIKNPIPVIRTARLAFLDRPAFFPAVRGERPIFLQDGKSTVEQEVNFHNSHIHGN